MNRTDDEVRMALATEAILFPRATELRPNDGSGTQKSLLVRSVRTLPENSGSITLEPLVAEHQWHTYTDQRVEVEAGFGAEEASARRMVDELRCRCHEIGMNLFAAEVDHVRVGAVGRFRLPEPKGDWARLQEVDIFPAWRGQGHGTAMMIAILRYLADEGVTNVVVGANEDDWPLSWYRRLGFRDVARVSKAH